MSREGSAPTAGASAGAARGDVAVAVGLGAVFLVVVGLGVRYPRDARLFPLIIGSVGLGLAGLTLVSLLVDRGQGPTRGEPPAGRSRVALGAAPAYAVFLWLAGFWIASLLAIPIFAALLGYRRLRYLIPVTLATVGATGLFFSAVMEIRLPRGLLVAWLLRGLGVP
ncbi:MAG: tripartite tricarboxylate transporter TctB family protein [Candidatus Rokuibacteriota bacterium]